MRGKISQHFFSISLARFYLKILKILKILKMCYTNNQSLWVWKMVIFMATILINVQPHLFWDFDFLNRSFWRISFENFGRSFAQPHLPSIPSIDPVKFATSVSKIEPKYALADRFRIFKLNFAINVEFNAWLFIFNDLHFLVDLLGQTETLTR